MHPPEPISASRARTAAATRRSGLEMAVGLWVVMGKLQTAHADIAVPVTSVGSASTVALTRETIAKDCANVDLLLTGATSTAQYQAALEKASQYYYKAPSCPEYAYMLMRVLDQSRKFASSPGALRSDKELIEEDNTIINLLIQSKQRKNDIITEIKTNGLSRTAEIETLLAEYTADRQLRINRPFELAKQALQAQQSKKRLVWILVGSGLLVGGLAMIGGGAWVGTRNAGVTGGACYNQGVPMDCLWPPESDAAIALGTAGGLLSLGGVAMIVGAQLGFKKEPPLRLAVREN